VRECEPFSSNISGRIDIAPIRKRTPLNVNGPINSIPARWAVNEKPQIIAVKSSKKSFFKRLIFIICTILLIIFKVTIAIMR
jgi:hypothetical protein